MIEILKRRPVTFFRNIPIVQYVPYIWSTPSLTLACLETTLVSCPSLDQFEIWKLQTFLPQDHFTARHIWDVLAPIFLLFNSLQIVKWLPYSVAKIYIYIFNMDLFEKTHNIYVYIYIYIYIYMVTISHFIWYFGQRVK